LPGDGTIFAERIGASFRPDSEAEVLTLSDHEVAINVHDLAIRKAPGKEYFLEVFIIRELLDDLRKDQQTIGSFQDQEVDRIIKYAEEDA